MEFNRRVLHEAEDERTPLLEHLKLIAIVSANLDEFFMKRIGGLKQLVAAELRDVSLDGLTPLQQIQECYMHPDGSYVQRIPGETEVSGGSHCQLIEHAKRRIELYRKRKKKRLRLDRSDSE